MWQKPMSHNNWNNEQYMMARYSEVANTAKLVRDGKMSVVEGAWRISALRN
jgi:hypothetical protein